MNGSPWSTADIELLCFRYPDTDTASIAAALRVKVSRVYQKAVALGLRKSAEYRASERSGRIQRGRLDPRMVATQFRKGHVTWNKGTHFVAGGRSHETRFKPGNVSKRWDPEEYGIGALRITTDSTAPGMLQIKIGEGPRQWVGMARYVWWSETGHWPTSNEVICLRNGDIDDVRIDNLECIARAELARRNRIWTNYPPAVARLVQLKGAINRQVNRIAKRDNP